MSNGIEWINFDYVWDEADVTWDNLGLTFPASGVSASGLAGKITIVDESYPQCSGVTWNDANFTWDQADTTWAYLGCFDPGDRSELGAIVTIYDSHGYNDLPGSITPAQPSGVSIDAKITLADKDYSPQLDATVTVHPAGHEDLDGLSTINRWDFRSLGATVGIPRAETLDGKIKLVTPDYTNFFAKVRILSTRDLDAKIYIKDKKDLGGRITPMQMLNASVTIPARSELDVTVDVEIPPEQILSAKCTVERSGTSDLDGTIVTGQYLVDLDARIETISDLQHLDATVNVGRWWYRDLGGEVNISIPPDQLLDGRIEIESIGTKDLDGSINVETDSQELDGTISVLRYGYNDGLDGTIDVAANFPGSVDPSGYVVPSGYPPTMPSGWMSGSICVPPSGTEPIPEGVWQNEEEFLFVWPELLDWGYEAEKQGYLVAWNDDSSYVVSESDQFVPNNYIRKTWYDSGSMWLHVRAKNSYGWLGEQASENIRINTLPSSPSGLYIDDPPPLNIGGHNIGGSPVFYWSNATDADELDVLNYHIQVSPSGSLEDTIINAVGVEAAAAGSVSSYTISSVQNAAGASVYDQYADDYVTDHDEMLAMEAAWSGTRSESQVTAQISGYGQTIPSGRWDHYLMKYTAKVYAATSGTYTFRTRAYESSSELLIDGTIVATAYDRWWGSATGTKYLTQGWHDLEFYMCTGSSWGWIDWAVSWKKPGEWNTVLIEASNLAHEEVLPDVLSPGDYQWRVRAYDTKQYGEWSSWAPLVVDSVNEDLTGRIKLVEYYLSNLSSTVDIIQYRELGAKVGVIQDGTKDLSASVVVQYKNDLDLDSKVRIFTTEDLSATINLAPYNDLHARINVIDVYGNDDFDASVNVCYKADIELGASITVKFGEYSDLDAIIRVPTNLDLSATVTTYTPEHYSFIPDFRTDFDAKIAITRPGSKDLTAKTTVLEETPGAVTVYCNVEEATWQTENNIEFTWDAAYGGFAGIEGYYTSIDQVSNTVADDSFQRTTGFARNFDLELLDGSAIYYFHIAAKNNYGTWGPTTHYEVRYNHVPSNPTTPMTVNEATSYGANPVVSSTASLTFEWGQSYDDDPLDSITYRLQIATQNNFGLDILGQSSIVYDVSGIVTFYKVVTGGQLESGRYYWRVIASDGLQSSDDWSPTASFSINTPPGTPSGLIVYKA